VIEKSNGLASNAEAPFFLSSSVNVSNLSTK
jgi:hypothetical protein